jgi:hypothetical protein
MSNAQAAFLGFGFLVFLIFVAFQLAQIYADGGLRAFLWPRLDHGYEVGHVTRLAVAPWLLLFCLLAGNGLSILVFDENLAGTPAKSYLPWLLSSILPVLVIHLVDYQRSVLAAIVALVLWASITLLVLLAVWEPLSVVLRVAVALALAVLLLWSLNGVRATVAERSMG